MSNPTEVVQELYAAYSRADMAAIVAKLSNDVVWESEGPAIISYAGVRHGIKETTGFFEGLAADYSKAELTVSEYVASGDTVMTLGRFKATSRKTGREFDTPIAHYWKIRDGKVVRYVGLANTAAAADAMSA